MPSRRPISGCRLHLLRTCPGLVWPRLCRECRALAGRSWRAGLTRNSPKSAPNGKPKPRKNACLYAEPIRDPLRGTESPDSPTRSLVRARPSDRSMLLRRDVPLFPKLDPQLVSGTGFCTGTAVKTDGSWWTSRTRPKARNPCGTRKPFERRGFSGRAASAF